jgi:hypothetical protein
LYTNNEKGYTALIHAFGRGHLEVVDLLLGKWANVGGTESREGRSEVSSIAERNRTTPFHQIISNNDIFQQVKALLNDTHIGTNNLLNASINFQELKKAHFYWKLTENYSSIYYCSSPYRVHITMLINSKMQLSVNISRCSRRIDVSVLSGVHALNLSGCYELVDVSALGRVHTLHLHGCSRLVDVSALGGVHTLDLHGCSRLEDVSALGGVHTLDLSGCSRVVNVSALGHVHDLNLSGCDDLVDVSALGGVHTLNLSRCEKVVDVSALGGVHTLNIRGCRRVVDITALVDVHSLIR